MEGPARASAQQTASTHLPSQQTETNTFRAGNLLSLTEISERCQQDESSQWVKTSLNLERKDTFDDPIGRDEPLHSHFLGIDKTLAKRMGTFDNITILIFPLYNAGRNRYF
jgi:hypothetical protein